LPVPEQPAGFCPCCVFPRGCRSYRIGNSCSYPSRVKSSDKGFRPRLSMPRPHVHGGRPSNPRRTPGRDAEQSEFRLVHVSVPVARERPLLVSVWKHHVHPPVVKEQSTPRYRCNVVVDVTLAGDRASPGRLAERDAEHGCRLLPGKCFKSQSHFRVISVHMRWWIVYDAAFPQSRRVHAREGVALSRRFRRVQSVTTRIAGIA
jgi:hypothetical protein